MSKIFGVTSQMSAETQLTNGYRLFDWVMRMNRFPAFWGREMIGNNAITKDEINYLHDNNCKVALIMNDLNEMIVSTNDGTSDAFRAIEAAAALNVPQNKGIAIFARIDSEWSVHHNWMMSFAQTIAKYGFVPGFIGNTDSSINFNFDRQCSHYVQATKDVAEYGAIYWATEPKINAEPSEWKPFCPSAITTDRIGLWSLSKDSIKYNDISVDEVYARDASLLEHMW